MHLSTKGAKKVMFGAAAAALLAVPASAQAAPTGPYADFANCNTTATANSPACLVADTTSGAIKLGNQNVPINKRIRLQGTFSNGFVPDDTLFPPKNGVPTLEKTPLDVPGGLSGLMVPSQFPEPVRSILANAINTVNGVTATAELVGQARFDFTNFQTGSAPSVILPTRVKLDNPFLGSNCYIGSASSPVTFRLTTGRTSPPAGVTPLQGTPGRLSSQDNGNIFVATGYSLVDNTFTAPAATGCGGIFSLLVNPVVNLKIGLPSGAGKNSATFKGNAKVADAAAVRASDPSAR